MNVKSKIVAGIAAVAPVFAFAADGDVAAQLSSTVTSNVASATGITVVAGLALIGLTFTKFLLRNGRVAASGKIGR